MGQYGRSGSPFTKLKDAWCYVSRLFEDLAKTASVVLWVMTEGIRRQW